MILHAFLLLMFCGSGLILAGMGLGAVVRLLARRARARRQSTTRRRAYSR